MRILKSTYLALAGLSLMSSGAMGHPGHEDGMGTLHAIASMEHAVAFLGMGVAAGVVALARHAWAVGLASGALLLFLLFQGATHAAENGLLFGIEMALGGAVLGLGAWRATRLLQSHLKSKKAQPL